MAVCLQERKTVKVRKDHTCQGCGIKINTGENCTVSKHADNGEAYSFYECDKCKEYYYANCNKCCDIEYCIGENYSVGIIRECMNDRSR